MTNIPTPIRAAAIVLHDVSPATLPLCKRLVDLVDGIAAAAPITHLVVPDFHRSGVMTEHIELRRWIDTRLARGDELALHGFYHLDEGNAPRTPTSWFARRMLTAGEAEFATLNALQAKQRIEQGLAAFARCGWQAVGFVPPAWQISAPARAVLSEFPFRYSSTTGTLRRLPSDLAYRVPCLGFSARTALRRWLSIKYTMARLNSLRSAPLLRIALHPADAAYPATLTAWRSIIHQVLSDRVAVTKERLLRYAEQQSPT
jgi:predicted deacetylase